MSTEPRRLKRVVIKEEFVELTGHYISALILNQFLYWTERVQDFDRFLLETQLRQKNVDIDLQGGWVYKTASDLSDELMIGVSHQTIRRYLQKLVDSGLVLERNNPANSWDRTLQYRVDIVAVVQALDALGYTLEGYTKLAPCIVHAEHCIVHGGQCNVQNRQSTVQNGRSNRDGGHSLYTEITTEITTENTVGGGISVGSTGNPSSSPAIAHPPPSLIDRAIELADKETFDPPPSIPRELGPPKPSSPPSSKPKPKPKPATTPRCDGRKFQGGYIPAGTGTTPVEVYYESFSINEAKLSAPNEDDLTSACPDLDRLRSVLTAYRRSNYRKGNVQLILDWYRDGVPAFGGAPAKKGQVSNGPTQQPDPPQAESNWLSRFKSGKASA